MTARDAVLLIDGEAQFFVWGNKGDLTGWVRGFDWETKICGCEWFAWEAAVELLVARAEVRK